LGKDYKRAFIDAAKAALDPNLCIATFKSWLEVIRVEFFFGSPCNVDSSAIFADLEVRFVGLANQGPGSILVVFPL
jgi:hypothetical protein